LDYERDAFLIWFSDLDAPTVDPYTGSHQNQDRITPRDRQRMSKRSYSPAALNQRLKRVEEKIRWFFIVCGTLATAIIVPVFIVPLIKGWLAKSTEHNTTRTQGTAAISTATPSISAPVVPVAPRSPVQTASVSPKTIPPTPTITPSGTPAPSATVSPSETPRP
jgi:hypothetical protein